MNPTTMYQAPNEAPCRSLNERSLGTTGGTVASPDHDDDIICGPSLAHASNPCSSMATSSSAPPPQVPEDVFEDVDVEVATTREAASAMVLARSLAPLIARRIVAVSSLEASEAFGTDESRTSFSVLQFNQLADGLGLDSFIRVPTEDLRWEVVCE